MKFKQIASEFILITAVLISIVLMIILAGYKLDLITTERHITINTFPIEVTKTPIHIVTATPEVTITPTVEPTATPTIEITPEPTAVPTSVPTATPYEEESEVMQYFSGNNKLYSTAYCWTDSSYPDEGGNVHYNNGAFATLIDLFDDSRVDDGYVVHSIATNSDLLPAGSIIYIPALNKYFRVDDNSSQYLMKRNTQLAWDKGCAIWIDIYVGKYAKEGDGGELIQIKDELKPYKEFIVNDILSFEIIRFGKK